MDTTDSGEPPPGLALLTTFILTAVALGGTADLVLDSRSRESPLHLGLELGLIIASVGGLLYLAWGWRAARRSLSAAVRALGERHAEREAWQASAERLLRGLALEVDRQLDSWGLTMAERDAAVRLIKGHSIKRIARETNRSEKTVRQHAVAAYRKSGLSGRAELAGFFLSGLLLPDRQHASSGSPASPASR